MERIHGLIDNLNKLKQQNASADDYLKEIENFYAAFSSENHIADKKIAVIFPAFYSTQPATVVQVPAVIDEVVPVVVETAPVTVAPPPPELLFEPQIEEKELFVLNVPEEALKQDIQELNRNNAPKNKTPELQQLSINDLLQQQEEARELQYTLKDNGGFKDLKKAIGINDRYIFINELFRGDETMFERSIKTINSFNIYAEAAFWISRELKLKLGWNADDPNVIEFDQLVKRRFS